MKKKIITKLNLTEISSVVTPAVEGATVAIMKSADGHRIKPVTNLVNPPAEFKADPARAEAALAGILSAMGVPVAKSNEKDRSHMTHLTTEDILKSRRGKGRSDEETFNSREYANAYDREEQEAVEMRRRAQTTNVDKAASDGLIREGSRILKPSELVMNYAQAHGCSQEQAFVAVCDTPAYKRAYEYFESTVQQVSSF